MPGRGRPRVRAAAEPVVERQLDGMHVLLDPGASAVGRRGLEDPLEVRLRDRSSQRRRNAMTAEPQKVVLEPRRPVAGQRVLEPRADGPSPLREAGAAGRGRRPELPSHDVVGSHADVAVHPGKTALGIEQHPTVGPDRRADAPGQRAEPVDPRPAGRAERAADEARVDVDLAADGLQAGERAVEVGPAHVGLHAHHQRAVLPVVAELHAGKRSGRPDFVAKQRLPIRVGDVAAVERAAQMRAEVQARPGERCRGRRPRRGRARRTIGTCRSGNQVKREHGAREAQDHTIHWGSSEREARTRLRAAIELR